MNKVFVSIVALMSLLPVKVASEECEGRIDSLTQRDSLPRAASDDFSFMVDDATCPEIFMQDAWSGEQVDRVFAVVLSAFLAKQWIVVSYQPLTGPTPAIPAPGALESIELLLE